MATIETEVARSRSAKTTSTAIKQLTFSVVDRALREQYGDNYSDRCLQGSVAANIVLERLGIDSRLVGGSVCVPMLGTGLPFRTGWQGFWDHDHHVWLHTEFNEFVDLTIAQIDKHGRHQSFAQVPPPPVWTNDIEFWQMMTYLPDGVGEVGLVGDEKDDLDALCQRVSAIMDGFTAATDLDEVAFGVILEGIATCEALFNQRDEWAMKAQAFQNSSEPLPSWVENRMHELVAESRRRHQ